MKKVFSIIIILISFSAFSQDPFLQDSNPQAKEMAKEITDKYISELGLTGKQILLFEQKVEEFQVKRLKVDATLSGKEKLDMFYLLQKEETAEMNDILTRPQLEVYKKVKGEIQPLDTVSKE